MEKRSPKTPDIELAKKKFADFLETVAQLRHPETGCPWDNEQTHETLTKYMIEEAYEASEAMLNGTNIAEELGDVLLQVVLNSQLAVDEGSFSIVDVIELVDSKMRRRHPHVFGTASREKDDIKKTWQSIKAAENKNAGIKKSEGIFGRAKVQKVRPSNLQAHKIGEIARTIDFDWKNIKDVLAQFNDEVRELNEELLKSTELRDDLIDEIGDVYFSLSQLTRHLGLNGEAAAQRGNEKFLKRFEMLESLAKKENINVETAGSDILEDLWRQAKKLNEP